MADIDQLIAKYIDLRDRKAELAKKQSEEMKPLSDAMNTIETYLMDTMNKLGVDQLKSREHGTAFKVNAASCKLADPLAFKTFVFTPVSDGILNYLQTSGYGLTDTDKGHLINIMLTMPLWDMVDLRAGKKGITEYIESENVPVPGIDINKIATVNIRRA